MLADELFLKHRNLRSYNISRIKVVSSVKGCFITDYVRVSSQCMYKADNNVLLVEQSITKASNHGKWPSC